MSGDFPVVQTCGLTKRFEHQLAVNEVDLEITAGEVYGLIGPNGAGKTTLIRLLATAEEPSRGQILINGTQLRRDRDNSKIKQRLGYLPDDFPVYDELTVWDYLEYFARLYYLRNRALHPRLF
jgi:ABC-2 type transport system ATP-binding protein